MDAQARGLTDQQAQQALNVAKNASVGNAPTSVAPYDPELVEHVVGIARMDFTSGLRITMLIAATLVPLVVAALAYFLIPRGPQRRPQSSTAVGQQAS